MGSEPKLSTDVLRLIRLIYQREEESVLYQNKFSVNTDHRIPHVTDVRDLGVPLDTTFTVSVHCIEAANI